MKKLRLFVPFFCIVSAVIGNISVRVYLPNGEELLPIDANFPRVYPPTIVGTELAVVIDSNTAEHWSGSLAITDANMDYGILSCRDSNDPGSDCVDSCLPAAGKYALVAPWEETGVRGYDLYAGVRDWELGEWFVIDYTATAVGVCSVGFYDHDVNWFDPNYHLSFPQIRTPDLDGSTIVDSLDFAVLSAHWQETDCSDPNWCEGTDLDGSRSVDWGDVSSFAYYWLETVSHGGLFYDPKSLERK